jgi:hypothetical protein
MNQDKILTVDHRAVARERDRSSVSWPLLRASCVNTDGKITT